MNQSHYWGVESNQALFDAGVSVELMQAGVAADRGHFVVNDRFDLTTVPHRFEYAISQSLFARLALNGVARVIVNVTRQLAPDGRFFASWFDNPDPQCFEPIARGGRLTTFPDREPYHYSFDVLANLCLALGVHAERLEQAGHPRGESVMVITRRAPPREA